MKLQIANKLQLWGCCSIDCDSFILFCTVFIFFGGKPALASFAAYNSPKCSMAMTETEGIELLKGVYKQAAV